MNALQAVSKALQMKLEAFKRNPQDESEELLEGAARLAIDVGIIMNSATLINEGQGIISWIEQWLNEQEEGYEEEMAESHAAYLASREPIREAHRLAKAIIGREYNDGRWIKVVDAYRTDFPTFIVRPFVMARFNPANQAANLRDLLLKVFEEKKLPRIPTEAEMRDFIPEATVRLQQKTLTYLERALPGFDFTNHPIMKHLAPEPGGSD